MIICDFCRATLLRDERFQIKLSVLRPMNEVQPNAEWCPTYHTCKRCQEEIKIRVSQTVCDLLNENARKPRTI